MSRRKRQAGQFAKDTLAAGYKYKELGDGTFTLEDSAGKRYTAADAGLDANKSDIGNLFAKNRRQRILNARALAREAELQEATPQPALKSYIPSKKKQKKSKKSSESTEGFEDYNKTHKVTLDDTSKNTEGTEDTSAKGNSGEGSDIKTQGSDGTSDKVPEDLTPEDPEVNVPDYYKNRLLIKNYGGDGDVAIPTLENVTKGDKYMIIPQNLEDSYRKVLPSRNRDLTGYTPGGIPTLNTDPQWARGYDPNATYQAKLRRWYSMNHPGEHVDTFFSKVYRWYNPNQPESHENTFRQWLMSKNTDGVPMVTVMDSPEMRDKVDRELSQGINRVKSTKYDLKLRNEYAPGNSYSSYTIARSDIPAGTVLVENPTYDENYFMYHTVPERDAAAKASQDTNIGNPDVTLGGTKPVIEPVPNTVINKTVSDSITTKPVISQDSIVQPGVINKPSTFVQTDTISNKLPIIAQKDTTTIQQQPKRKKVSNKAQSAKTSGSADKNKPNISKVNITKSHVIDGRPKGSRSKYPQSNTTRNMTGKGWKAIGRRLYGKPDTTLHSDTILNKKPLLSPITHTTPRNAIGLTQNPYNNIW